MIPPVAQPIADHLRDAPSLRALLLSGSHGKGTADAHSDVDLILVTPEGATDAIAGLFKRSIEPLGRIVLWRDRVIAPTMINAIVAPATRIDGLILRPDQLSHHTQDSMHVLFDHDDLFATLAQTAPTTRIDRKRIAYQIEEFIRILGLLPLVVGREEYINGVTGLMHLRTLLIDLLIAEAAVPYKGGALTLNSRLTEDHRNLLMSLPPLVPTPDGVIEAHRAYAAAYLHRARAFALAHGIDWPEAFEDAMLTHIGETIGLKIT